MFSIEITEKMPQRHLRNQQDPTHGRLKSIKVKTHLRDCGGTLLTQGFLEVTQALRGHYSHCPRGPSYCFSWQQTWASPTWYWFFRNADAEVRGQGGFHKISKEGLEGQAKCSRVGIPAGSL